MRKIVAILTANLLLMLPGEMCVYSFSQEGKDNIVNAKNSIYKNGIYEGEYSFIKVQVTIENGYIEDIIILQHGGGGQKYADMITPLVNAVIKEQSYDIDAITGATVSSNNFKYAVKNALEKAIFK